MTLFVGVFLVFSPQVSFADLSSENFTVGNPVITPIGITSTSTSASYQLTPEYGNVYHYDVATTPTTTGSSGGGGGSTTNKPPPEVVLAPSPDTSVLIGPKNVLIGEQVVLVLLLKDENGVTISAEEQDVVFTVTGANDGAPVSNYLGGGMYRATYSASHIGVDQVTVRLNGVKITQDSDGVSDGTLNITISAVTETVTPPDTTVPSEVTDDGQDVATDDGSDDQSGTEIDPYLESGITASCHPIFTWDGNSSVLISRRTDNSSPTIVARIGPKMPWFIEVHDVRGAPHVIYHFSFSNGHNEEVWFSRSDFDGCVQDAGGLVREDIDNDGNDEYFVDGIYLDGDGTTVPVATSPFGLLLDSRKTGLYDLFWNPKQGTSEVIEAGDRFFVSDASISRTQEYARITELLYTVSLDDNAGAFVVPVVLATQLTTFNSAPLPREKLTLRTVANTVGRIVVPPIVGLVSTVMDHKTAVGVVGATGGVMISLFSLARVPFSFSNFGNLFARGWTGFIGLFFFRRRHRAWGTVYDSVTKAPVDPAYIELFTPEGKKVAEAITDLDGRYGFLVPEGTYVMNVMKAHYQFPSQKTVFAGHDVIYNNLYLGGTFQVGGVVAHDVPVDPIAFDWNQWEKMRTNQTLFIHRFDPLIAQVTIVLFYFGFASVLWQLYVTPGTILYLLTGLYTVLLLIRFFVGKPLLYGTLKRSTVPLAFAIVRVFRGEMEVTNKVSDMYGRYVALVSPGTYTITIEERVSENEYRPALTQVVTTKDGVIDANFAIR